MAGEEDKLGRSLEETPTWAVAAVFVVLIAVSIVIEYVIHLIGHWFKKKHKIALYEALEKVKAELMLLGFISLLLTVLQGEISKICIPKSAGDTWHPCDKKAAEESDNSGQEDRRRKLLGLFQYSGGPTSTRRILAGGYTDKCLDKGKVALVSKDGIHQLHIFIFVLAVVHVLYCITTLALGRAKMRKWKSWENETKTIEYQYSNDPERFRFARNTTFGRRHLKFWSQSTVLLWMMCFFRQFFRSVTKIDYWTLRHGFIAAHLAPGSEAKFDFRKYISRSLDEDFKVVVGISPIIWFFAMLFLLSNVHGWYSYLWLPFIPLIIILVVGAKLQVSITKMGLRIQERGDIVKGAPVVQPDDNFFWFGSPRFILFLIHFVLFQNAFQLAFFVWSTYEFGWRSCFHERLEDIIIRISMGVIIQFICSYVTLPLYALVTQMGSTMRPTIFTDRVATGLQSWYHSAKKQAKHGHSGTSYSARPSTSTDRMSPVHLLHNFPQTLDSNQTSPRVSNCHNINDRCLDADGSPSPPLCEGGGDEHWVELSSAVSSRQATNRTAPTNQREIDIKDFSFEKRGINL
ncbi:MLO-like protein 12 [Malania oleifera]|uniref:MLO-like protein 12 n=1 Tax=Malania oleifera TaxID=397392 RepID=UPI0025AE63EA|nr:MLO-like protein 12 [Malania oleifera]